MYCCYYDNCVDPSLRAREDAKNTALKRFQSMFESQWFYACVDDAFALKMQTNISQAQRKRTIAQKAITEQLLRILMDADRCRIELKQAHM
jgi:hypothetical protein